MVLYEVFRQIVRELAPSSYDNPDHSLVGMNRLHTVSFPLPNPEITLDTSVMSMCATL